MYRLCLQSNLRLSCCQAEILYAHIINQRVLHVQPIPYYLTSASLLRKITNYGTCHNAVFYILLLPLSSQFLKCSPESWVVGQTLRINKIGNVRVQWHWGAFVRSSSQWKSSIIYSDCALVALGIRHAMRMRHIVICGLSAPIIFLHIIS